MNFIYNSQATVSCQVYSFTDLSIGPITNFSVPTSIHFEDTSLLSELSSGVCSVRRVFRFSTGFDLYLNSFSTQSGQTWLAASFARLLDTPMLLVTSLTNNQYGPADLEAIDVNVTL